MGVGVVGEMEMPLGFGKVGFFLFFLFWGLGGMRVSSGRFFLLLFLFLFSWFQRLGECQWMV